MFGWTIQPAPEFDCHFVQTGETDADSRMLNGAGYIGGGICARSSEVPAPVITIAVDIASALERITAASCSAVGETA